MKVSHGRYAAHFGPRSTPSGARGHPPQTRHFVSARCQLGHLASGARHAAHTCSIDCRAAAGVPCRSNDQPNTLRRNRVQSYCGARTRPSRPTQATGNSAVNRSQAAVRPRRALGPCRCRFTTPRPLQAARNWARIDVTGGPAARAALPVPCAAAALEGSPKGRSAVPRSGSSAAAPARCQQSIGGAEPPAQLARARSQLHADINIGGWT